MKKSYLARLVCLAVAGLVLCSALAAAAVSGSPYETLKSSLFDLAQAKNFTMSSDVRLYMDGEIIERNSQRTLQGDNASLSYYYDDTFSYNSEAYNLRTWNGFDGEEIWYDAQAPGYYSGGNAFFGMSLSSYSRFAELLVDLLVGDIKNNISMSRDGDVRNISGTLTASQVPELYNAALELALTQQTSGRTSISNDEIVSFDYADMTCVVKNTYLSGLDKTSDYTEYTVAEVRDPANMGYAFEYNGRHYDYTDSRYLRTETEPATPEDYKSAGSRVDMLPLTRARFTYIHGDAVVDDEGRLQSISGTVSADTTDIFGEDHELEFAFGLEVSDIGTTDPECPVAGVEQLLAQYRDDSARYSSVRFTLAADGSIDTSSVFDNMTNTEQEKYAAQEDYSDDAMDSPIGG